MRIAPTSPSTLLSCLLPSSYLLHVMYCSFLNHLPLSFPFLLPSILFSSPVPLLCLTCLVWSGECIRWFSFLPEHNGMAALWGSGGGATRAIQPEFAQSALCGESLLSLKAVECISIPLRHFSALRHHTVYIIFLCIFFSLPFSHFHFWGAKRQLKLLTYACTHTYAHTRIHTRAILSVDIRLLWQSVTVHVDQRALFSDNPRPTHNQPRPLFFTCTSISPNSIPKSVSSNSVWVFVYHKATLLHLSMPCLEC